MGAAVRCNSCLEIFLINEIFLDDSKNYSVVRCCYCGSKESLTVRIPIDSYNKAVNDFAREERRRG